MGNINNCPFLFAHIMVYKLYEKTRYKGKINKTVDLKLSESDKKLLANGFAALALTGASATFPSIALTLPIILTGAATALVWVPLIVGATSLTTGYLLYVYANGGNFKSAFGDVLTDLVFNEV